MSGMKSSGLLARVIWAARPRLKSIGRELAA